MEIRIDDLFCGKIWFLICSGSNRFSCQKHSFPKKLQPHCEKVQHQRSLQEVRISHSQVYE